MQKEIVLSPISNRESLKIETIPTSIIIEKYKKEGIDVADYFKDLPEIYIYQCPDTQYRFYHPKHIAGSDSFYETLQQFDWYYQDWKWDYTQAISYINDGERVLDIGCGSGRFLKYLKENKGCDCTGLEFNDKAIQTALKDDLNVRNEFIEKHSENPENRYDVVCAFQVLEHIVEAGDFLKAAINCVKPGGKLLLCVPNNNPWYFQYLKLHTFNLPPHHMNMWNKEGFNNLAKFYGLSLTEIVEENVSRYRYYAKAKITEENKSGILGLILYPFYTLSAFLNKNRIKAGNIFVVFKK